MYACMWLSNRTEIPMAIITILCTELKAKAKAKVSQNTNQIILSPVDTII